MNVVQIINKILFGIDEFKNILLALFLLFAKVIQNGFRYRINPESIFLADKIRVASFTIMASLKSSMLFCLFIIIIVVIKWNNAS
jgi:hypothetical protein